MEFRVKKSYFWKEKKVFCPQNGPKIGVYEVIEKFDHYFFSEFGLWWNFIIDNVPHKCHF